MARCGGCSEDRCSCKIIAGANVQVTGAGTSSNPYQIAAVGGGGGGGGNGGGGGGGDIPVGTIWMFGGAVAPAGWLLCNGASVSRSGFGGLFGVIGTTYGPGDGATTFTLPDLAGRGPFGADVAHPLGSIGGQEATVIAVNQMPVHGHYMNHSHRFDHGHTGWTDAQGNHTHGVDRRNDVGNGPGIPRGSQANEADTNTKAAGSHSHNVGVSGFAGSTGNAEGNVTSANGGNTPLNTMDPYTAVSFIIKT